MIIVNADDFGRSESISRSIIYGLEHKIINRTTAMMNMPYVKQAINLACNSNFLNVIGLHLTLDEGFPITEEIKNIDLFCDKEGRFNGNFRKSKKFYFSLMDSSIEKICSEEINSQMQCYKAYGLSLLHMDSHHHVHTIPAILKLAIPLAKDHGFISMRLRFNMQDSSIIKKIRTSLVNKFISKNFDTTDFFCDSTYIKEKPLNGYSYEVMCHPDYVDNRYVDVIGNVSDHNYLDLSHLSFLLK